MPYRHREFSQIRSQLGSRCPSQFSQSNSIIEQLNFNSSTKQNSDCFGCINKTLALSRKEEAKRKADLEAKEHLENIKRINSMKDYQRQHRQKMVREAAQYNKSLTVSQCQSLKNLKKIEDIEVIEQITRKERQFARNEETLKRSRIQLKQSYKKELTGQLQQQKSRKLLQISRVKTQNPSQVNNLKVIEESERYHNTMKEQVKKCQKQNKKMILQRSFQKLQDKQKSIRDEKMHMERVEKQLQKFTQFQPIDSSPYRASRSILSSSQNPEDVFTELKRIQTEKTFTKITQRKQKNNERMIELKKQEEQNRQLMQKKISSMKSYVEELTNQVLEKRQRKAKETHYTKHYQPEKSRVDCFTEEQQKKVQPCNSCERVYDQKYLGTIC